MGPEERDGVYMSLYNASMKRTTVMAEPDTLDRLRRLSRERGVSFAEVVREALVEKAAEYLPAPTCLGLFESGSEDGSVVADAGRIPPRSWR